MADARVEGENDVAAAAGRSVAQVRREVATYPDPLPAWKLRGTKGRLWGLRSRIALWAQRHPADGAPVSSDLVVLDGADAIGRVVRIHPGRLWMFLPWTRVGKSLFDPLPVWLGEDGRLRAYRDALHDWLDRRSEHAGAGKAPATRRRWRSRLVTATKRGRGGEEERLQKPPVRTRENPESTVQKIRQEASTAPAKKARRAA